MWVQYRSALGSRGIPGPASGRLRSEVIYGNPRLSLAQPAPTIPLASAYSTLQATMPCAPRCQSADTGATVRIYPEPEQIHVEHHLFSQTFTRSQWHQAAWPAGHSQRNARGSADGPKRGRCTPRLEAPKRVGRAQGFAETPDGSAGGCGGSGVPGDPA